MKITIKNLGKRFHYHWIFRNLSFEFDSNKTYAITGSNGSGKSTLLKLLFGIDSPNEGEISYSHQGVNISSDLSYKNFTFASPYQELIEELTLLELLLFHSKFRSLSISIQDFLAETKLQDAKNKLVRDFSSGMKQRVKLGLALYTKSACILLDEPTTNMDQQGIDWYLKAILKQVGQRTIIISSNMPFEYSFADKTLKIEDFKQTKL